MKMLKHLKIYSIVFVVFFSLIASLFPSASAVKVGQGQLKMEFDSAAAQQIVEPLGSPIYIPIKVSYLVSGVFAPFVAKLFSSRGIPVMIELSIEDAPKWCTAVITPGVISTDVSTSYRSTNATLVISVNENAPAFMQSKVRIKMHARPLQGFLFEVGEVEFSDEVPFTPGYSPVISFTTPQGNFKEISPGSTAKFNINIENLGNAKTEVTFKILSHPKGWSPNIISAVVLGAKNLGEETTMTVPFVVQPPYNFGYHNERQSFQVSLTPAYYRDPTLVGREYVLTFVVQNRGFSLPGFEITFVFLAIIIAMYISRRKNL